MGRGRAFSEWRGGAGRVPPPSPGAAESRPGTGTALGPGSEPPGASARQGRPAEPPPHDPRLGSPWSPCPAAPVICGSREGNNGGTLLREARARSAPRLALAGWRVAVPAAWAAPASPGAGLGLPGGDELPEQGSGSEGLSGRSAGPKTALKLSQEGAGLSHGGVFLVVEL